MRAPSTWVPLCPGFHQCGIVLSGFPRNWFRTASYTITTLFFLPRFHRCAFSLIFYLSGGAQGAATPIGLGLPTTSARR